MIHHFMTYCLATRENSFISVHWWNSFEGSISTIKLWKRLPWVISLLNSTTFTCLFNWRSFLSNAGRNIDFQHIFPKNTSIEAWVRLVNMSNCLLDYECMALCHCLSAILCIFIDFEPLQRKFCVVYIVENLITTILSLPLCNHFKPQ